MGFRLPSSGAAESSATARPSAGRRFSDTAASIRATSTLVGADSSGFQGRLVLG